MTRLSADSWRAAGRRCGLLLALAAGLAGCVSVSLPPPGPSIGNLQLLRGGRMQAARTGEFVLAPGKPASLDEKLGGLRGSSLSAQHGSFARYLRDTLQAELQAAGYYDEAAAYEIRGQLTDSQVDAGISTGTARLAARFQVVRDGVTLFDKELFAESRWESSAVGAIALPEAINRYATLYRSLVGKLFADADFQRALGRETRL